MFREVLLTPFGVFVVHLVRVALPVVEDATEFGLVVERIHSSQSTIPPPKLRAPPSWCMKSVLCASR